MKKAAAEKTLSSSLAYDGRFLKVQKDEVLTPEGKTYVREYIRHPGAAMIIPVLNEKTVVMVRQFRYSLKQFFWEFPAGKIDPGEKSLETAKRELVEETGYTAESMRYLTAIYPVIGYADERIDFYLATDLKPGEMKLDEGESLEVHEVPIADLITQVRRGEIGDVKTQLGVFWLERVLQQGW